MKPTRTASPRFRSFEPYSGPPVRLTRSRVNAVAAGPDGEEAGAVAVYDVELGAEGAAPGAVGAVVAAGPAAGAVVGALAGGATAVVAGAGVGGVLCEPFDEPSARPRAGTSETTRRVNQLTPKGALMGTTVPRSIERAKHFNELVGAVTTSSEILCGGVVEAPVFPGFAVDATHRIEGFLYGDTKTKRPPGFRGGDLVSCARGNWRVRR